MTSVIMTQWVMWALLGIGLLAIWAIYFLLKRDMTVAVATSVGLTLLLIGTYSVGMWVTSDVEDWCVLNGHVVSASYNEHWTETYITTETTYDSKGRVTGTRQVVHTVDHPDQWSVESTVGSESVSSGVYASMKSRFHNEVQIPTIHGDQSSRGDGRVFRTQWPLTRETIIPWSSTKAVVNWVKASKGTVYKT